MEIKFFTGVLRNPQYGRGKEAEGGEEYAGVGGGAEEGRGEVGVVGGAVRVEGESGVWLGGEGGKERGG